MYFLSSSNIPSYFKLVKTDSETWEKYYLDERTQIMWIAYSPYEEDRSPEFLRREDLPTRLIDLLRICFESPDKIDWIGLGAHLSAKKYGIDELLRFLEENKDRIKPKALNAFASAYMPKDTRNIIGMNYQEVCSSYESFKKSVKRIKEITKKSNQ